MTNSLKAYAAATSSFAVVFRNFLVWSARRKDHVICALEGQDHMYYESRVRVVIPEASVSHFHMGGKNNVLELLELAKTNKALSGLNIAFFIDKDFERPKMESPHLYVTPGYSIENHYVTKTCFRRVLLSCFDVRELVQQGANVRENDELDRLVDFCCKVLDEYTTKIGAQLNAFLFAAYKSARSKGMSGHGLPTKDFDARIFPTLFEVNAAGLMVKQVVTYDWLLSAYCTTEEAVEPLCFNALLEDWARTDAIQHGRGKFLFIVMLAILNFLREDGRRTKPKVFSTRQPCKIDESDVPLASLSSFADTPPELTAFLRRLRVLFKYETTMEPVQVS